MRLAVVQTEPVFGQIEGNIARVLEMMRREKADLYVLPELFATGYNFEQMSELEGLAEPATGRTFRAMSEFTRSHSCHVVYGFAERADRLYNAAALVGPGGLLGMYRKVHLFYRERLFFAAGNLGFPVFDLPFGRVGLMICFDWIYPESARSLALSGAQLIAHPSNLVLPYCPDAMVTRCLENRVFAATADRVGIEARGGITLSFVGMSEIVTPKGEVLLRLGRERAEIASADIELSEATSKRVNEFNDLLADRQVSQYTASHPSE